MLTSSRDGGMSLEVLESIEAADGPPDDRSEDAGPSPAGEAALRGGALERRYRAYCRQQATALLSLLPREAIRPLHREALAWARGAGGHAHDPTEPLETLIAYCRHLLPLPPFPAWREDLRQNPLAHVEATLQGAGPGATAVRPVTLATGTVERDGTIWDAGLRVFADEGVWRGYIVFRCRDDGRRARTTHVFREEGPEEVRRRFLELAPATLAAFLRSSLP